jgi:hypothetical protein
MVSALKIFRIVSLACIMWIGVSLNASDAKANVSSHICEVVVLPGGVGLGNLGAIQVKISDMTCSRSLEHIYYFCSSGATYGRCAAASADLISSESTFKKLSQAFKDAMFLDLTPYFQVGACRNTYYKACPKAKPITFM